MSKRMMKSEVLELAEMVLGTSVSFELCGRDVLRLRDLVEHVHQYGATTDDLEEILILVDLATAPRGK